MPGNRFFQCCFSKKKSSTYELDAETPTRHIQDLGSTSTPSESMLTEFQPLTCDDVEKLVLKSKSTSCSLDPIPTSLLKSCISAVSPVLTKIVNMSLQTGNFSRNLEISKCYPFDKET